MCISPGPPRVSPVPPQYLPLLLRAVAAAAAAVTAMSALFITPQPQSKVQTHAVHTLARWGEPGLAAHKQQLLDLISDKTFRDTLTLFVVEPDALVRLTLAQTLNRCSKSSPSPSLSPGPNLEPGAQGTSASPSARCIPPASPLYLSCISRRARSAPPTGLSCCHSSPPCSSRS